MDPGRVRIDGKSKPEIPPNAKPVAANGNPTALTDLNDSVGGPTNQAPPSTPWIFGRDNFTPISHSDSATVTAIPVNHSDSATVITSQTTANNYIQNQPMIHNNPRAQQQPVGQDQHQLRLHNQPVFHHQHTVHNYPTVQGQHMLQNLHMLQHQLMPQSQPMPQPQSQSIPQSRPTEQNHHVIQNQPNIRQRNIHHYHGSVQNIGYAPAAPSHQNGAPGNGPSRTLVEQQTWRHSHATEAGPSTSSQPMAQASQPAQPPKRWRSEDKDIDQVREWLEERGNNFGHHIHNFRDVVKYREAEKRTRVKPTIDLARDFPSNPAEQEALAERLFRSFKVWRAGTPGWTKQAINRILLEKNFILELTAWQLLGAAYGAQRGELLLPARVSKIEHHDTFMERFEALEHALSVNAHLAGSTIDSVEWIDRAAASPKGECGKKFANVKGNTNKNELQKQAIRMKRSRAISNVDSASDSEVTVTPTTVKTGSRRSSRVAAKRQKTENTPNKIDHAEDEDRSPQTPASHSSQNAEAPVHLDLGQNNHTPGLTYSQIRINAQPQTNNRAQAYGQPQGNYPQGNNFTPTSFSPSASNQPDYTQCTAQGPMLMDPRFELRLDENGNITQIRRPATDFQGQVPANGHFQAQNGMMMMPHPMAIPPDAQHTTFVPHDANYFFMGMMQPNQGAGLMTHEQPNQGGAAKPQENSVSGSSSGGNAANPGDDDFLANLDPRLRALPEISDRETGLSTLDDEEPNQPSRTMSPQSGHKSEAAGQDEERRLHVTDQAEDEDDDVEWEDFLDT